MNKEQYFIQNARKHAPVEFNQCCIAVKKYQVLKKQGLDRDEELGWSNQSFKVLTETLNFQGNRELFRRELDEYVADTYEE